MLSENGRSALNRFLETFRNHLDTIEVDVDLERLAELLGRISTACLNAPEPPGTWAIRHSRNIAPADDAPALAKIDQYLDDLNAFRDDAHIAAFAPHNISGHGWELFSMLWRKQVKSAAEMVEKRSGRGHDEAAIALPKRRKPFSPQLLVDFANKRLVAHCDLIVPGRHPVRTGRTPSHVRAARVPGPDHSG